VREDAQLLYGFADESQRRLFRVLLRVSGIGAKMALAVLSGMSADDFARSIESDDVTALTRVPGIGRKTAQRLIVEMRDRLDDDLRGVLPAAAGAAAADTGGAAPGDGVGDAIAALVALGYRHAEAERMVRSVDTEGAATEEIIRRALQTSLR